MKYRVYGRSPSHREQAKFNRLAKRGVLLKRRFNGKTYYASKNTVGNYQRARRFRRQFQRSGWNARVVRVRRR